VKTTNDDDPILSNIFDDFQSNDSALVSVL
jgi:hypothetical protein